MYKSFGKSPKAPIKRSEPVVGGVISGAIGVSSGMTKVLITLILFEIVSEAIFKRADSFNWSDRICRSGLVGRKNTGVRKWYAKRAKIHKKEVNMAILKSLL